MKKIIPFFLSILFPVVCAAQFVTVPQSTSANAAPIPAIQFLTKTGPASGTQSITWNVTAGPTYIVACIQGQNGGPGITLGASISSSVAPSGQSGAPSNWSRVGSQFSTSPNTTLTVGYGFFTSSGNVTFNCNIGGGSTNLTISLLVCASCAQTIGGSFFGTNSGSSTTTSQTVIASASQRSYTLVCNSNGSVSSTSIIGVSGTHTTGVQCFFANLATGYTTQNVVVTISSAANMAIEGVPLFY